MILLGYLMTTYAFGYRWFLSIPDLPFGKLFFGISPIIVPFLGMIKVLEWIVAKVYGRVV